MFSRDSMCFETPGAKENVLHEKEKHFEKLLSVSDETLQEITRNFVKVLSRGLEQEDQVVPMFPTFVFNWPTGKETGDFLSLDMGGTNIRTCLVRLKGDRTFELTQSKFRIQETYKHVDGQILFDYFAECIRDFIEQQYGSCDNISEDLSLGFTFSYPTVQKKSTMVSSRIGLRALATLTQKGMTAPIYCGKV